MSRGLGKIEKEILRVLSIWKEVNPGFEWFVNKGSLAQLADETDIESFKQGERTPMWMLRRDIECGKTVLARALKTLSEKGLIILYGADLAPLGAPCTYYAKYVGLTNFRQNGRFAKLALK